MTPKPHPAFAELRRAHRFSFSDRCLKREIVGLRPICQSCGHTATTGHFSRRIVTWGWGDHEKLHCLGVPQATAARAAEPWKAKAAAKAFCGLRPSLRTRGPHQGGSSPLTIECRGRAERPEAGAAPSPASGGASLLGERLQPRTQFPWGLKMAPRGEVLEVCESLILIPSVPFLPSARWLNLNPPFSGVRDSAPHLSKAEFRSLIHPECLTVRGEDLKYPQIFVSVYSRPA